MLALTWISLAFRPLEVEELQHALAVRPGDRNFDSEALPDIALVVSVSAGLITIDEDSRTVGLVHFTVEEYFRKKKANLFPRADILLAETCITYVSYDQVTKNPFYVKKFFLSSGTQLRIGAIISVEAPSTPFKTKSSTS